MDVCSQTSLKRGKEDSSEGWTSWAQRESKSHLWAICLMFFCSGMASLICEVVWFKQLQFVLGSSTFSVSVVVACFFSGLALGGWLGGRWADRSQKLLRTYGLLELSLALASAAVTVVLFTWETWVLWLLPWLGSQSLAKPVTVVFSVVVLIVPTTLMGSTLPVLCKYLVRERSQLGQRLGLLYAVNTLGGAVGCALVGFLLIGWLGVIQSALIASLLYVAVALGAVLLYRGPESGMPNASDVPAPSGQPGSPLPMQILALVFTLMGFASIAYEVLWFRILTFFGIHTVYAFAGMLSTYLIGLVLGTAICTRFLLPRTDRHMVIFARLQLLEALAAVVSLGLLARSRNLLLYISLVERQLGILEVLSDPLAQAFTFTCLCMLVLLVPTTIIGMGFPLATELLTRRFSVLGKQVGTLYSFNTLGGVLGSLLVGFVLLPLLGSLWCFLLIVTLNVILFALIIGCQPALRRDRGLQREGMLTVCALIAVFAFLGKDYLKNAMTNFTDAAILAFRESPDATFVVAKYESPRFGPSQQLIVNGTSYANNSLPGRRYMSTLANLPTLLHPHPRSALVIAIGTGTTVGTLTLHRSLEEICAVDIAADVFNLAPFFAPFNHHFTECSRVTQIVADGRHFLLTTDRQFDVLTFEPPPPIEAGVVNLYSQEFYRLAKRRMNHGGVLCQWVPLDMGPEKLPRMVLKTLMAEFPHVSFWIPNRMEGVAVASLEPPTIDMEELGQRLRDPLLHADMESYGLAEPEQLLSTLVAMDDDLLAFVGQVPLVTDNQPRTEYHMFYAGRDIRYDDVLPHCRPVEKYLARPPANPHRLEQCRQVTTDIWLAHELVGEERLERIQHGLTLDPNNRYLEYLRDD